VPAAMVGLARGYWSERPILGGESAVAGLCGFLQAAGDSTLADVMGLGTHSRVLLFGTEGATDPEIFRNLTGVDPSAPLGHG
jgi:diaminopropionate ammonia-lyase